MIDPHPELKTVIAALARSWQEAAKRMEATADLPEAGWRAQRLLDRAETYRSLARQLLMELHGLTEEDMHETAWPTRPPQ